jgi:hypothetical protein
MKLGTLLFILTTILLFNRCAGKSNSEKESYSSNENKDIKLKSDTQLKINQREIQSNESVAREYDLKDYHVIDTFSPKNSEYFLPKEKPFILKTYQFDENDKIYYNTGVKIKNFCAIIAGFNSGNIDTDKSSIDGIVARMVPVNGYWYFQGNFPNFYFKERITVDILFIKSDWVEVIRK